MASPVNDEPLTASLSSLSAALDSMKEACSKIEHKQREQGGSLFSIDALNETIESSNDTDERMFVFGDKRDTGVGQVLPNIEDFDTDERMFVFEDKRDTGVGQVLPVIEDFEASSILYQDDTSSPSLCVYVATSDTPSSVSLKKWTKFLRKRCPPSCPLLLEHALFEMFARISPPAVTCDDIGLTMFNLKRRRGYETILVQREWSEFASIDSTFRHCRYDSSDVYWKCIFPDVKDDNECLLDAFDMMLDCRGMMFALLTEYCELAVDKLNCAMDRVEGRAGVESYCSDGESVLLRLIDVLEGEIQNGKNAIEFETRRWSLKGDWGAVRSLLSRSESLGDEVEVLKGQMLTQIELTEDLQRQRSEAMAARVAAEVKIGKLEGQVSELQRRYDEAIAETEQLKMTIQQLRQGHNRNFERKEEEARDNRLLNENQIQKLSVTINETMADNDALRAELRRLRGFSGCSSLVGRTFNSDAGSDTGSAVDSVISSVSSSTASKMDAMKQRLRAKLGQKDG